MSERDDKDGTIIPLFGDPPSEGEATGQFNDEDEGALQFGISHDPDQGVVILAFGKPVGWIAFQPETADDIGNILKARSNILREHKFHRTAPDIPTDSAVRKAVIEQLMDHPLWTYPVMLRVPPTEDGYFGEPQGEGKHKVVPMVFDGPDWHEEEHRIGGGYRECVSFDFVYVDPETESIRGEGQDDPRNTAFRVWIEAGGWHDRSTDENEIEPEGGWDKYNRWLPTHDTNLDCGASDMESALLELARLVAFFYNDDGSPKENAPEKCEGSFVGDDEEADWVSGCKDAGDGYCEHCGFVMGWHEGSGDEEKP